MKIGIFYTLSLSLLIFFLCSCDDGVVIFYLASANKYQFPEKLFCVGSEYSLGLARGTSLEGPWDRLKGDGSEDPASSDDAPILPNGILDGNWDNNFVTSFASLVKQADGYYLFYTGHGYTSSA